MENLKNWQRMSELTIQRKIIWKNMHRENTKRNGNGMPTLDVKYRLGVVMFKSHYVNIVNTYYLILFDDFYSDTKIKPKYSFIFGMRC